MYRKVDPSLDFNAREKEVIEFWNQNGIFEKSIRQNEGHEEFTFYDGPPTANGKPHVGHVLTRVMKDIVPRYQTMKGKHVLRKAGWDTHGLPVELEIEKKLGLDGKQDIEKYGIEPFINECKQSVWKYTDEWKKMSDRLGYWVDMDHPYVTYHDNYIESVWWALKTIHEKGLLYKGHKIVPYCPRCGTALSSHEVAQGYKLVKEKSVFVKFRKKGEENTYFLVWTTTPWTLSSNVALCMNPDFDYVEIRTDGGNYILAEALVPTLFDEYEVVSRKKGKDYEYAEYEPMYPYAIGSFREKAFYVTNDGYVTLSDGTGIVHIAPAFGEDDSNVGRKYGLPFVRLVDERGKFVDAVEPYKGMFVKDADKFIIKDLKEAGVLFKDELYEHSYPFCWRCNTPLLYYARSSWFIRTTAIKDELIASNKSVNWMPETIGTGRMGNFLENVIDWGLSRERYWGTPLPVWVCDDCGEIHVMGSKAELKEKCGIEGDIELHRPYIDKPTCKCEKCGGTMRRVKEVIDCWFDSGSMPFAQYHYPFENKELFEKHFPADFISEAVDQTRGWFYTLLTISTLLFGKAPFRNCIVLGHVNDKNGVKMSKHIGNVIDPWSVLDKQGADAVRWYFYTSSAPWLPSRFSAEAVSEGQRKFMGTLWNTYAFFVLYAGIDGYDPSAYELKKCKLSLMDRWVISRLNSLVKTVDGGLAEYKIFETSRAIGDFVDELSNWYVRRGRERYWGKEMTEDKIAAYTTLYTVLVTLSKIIAPYVPFVAEEIYLNLVPGFYSDAPESVHLCSFPQADETLVDKELEEGMEDVLEIVALGRSARNGSNIKNRQPLSRLYVAADRKVKLSEGLYEIARDELNVKEVEILENASRFVTYKIKPQLKTLGPKYGAKLGLIRNFLETCNAEEVVSTVKSGKAYAVELGGTQVEFTLDDLLISSESAEGFVSESSDGLTVVLDAHVTDELRTEGMIREIVSRVQTMRKEAGFEVTDRIELSYLADGLAGKVLAEKGEEIGNSVLALSVNEGLFAGGYEKSFDIGDDKATFSVRKVGKA
ncbi:MAG: isoleucine--tRNA ligase [Candidatus Borkfalkiaceae bacterium]|nr:isoleucine--tRNA ligase [Christensenellaceae bacterium]